MGWLAGGAECLWLKSTSRASLQGTVLPANGKDGAVARSAAGAGLKESGIAVHRQPLLDLLISSHDWCCLTRHGRHTQVL